ncbi:hypothetical protein LP090_11190 [Moraxella bovis]|uniref:hypothetical protein n=1 Tax=Moraxella bovis TaxID=476 RepID=UPI00222694B9|nr:hypothetical protein [Moraxella bovis]UZA42726.1 hypothetical protein LP090_11190 [Moraxella bovis]
MALISKNYPMNVSPNWLKQIDIAENGTTEQKIALAGSDEILDSIQYLLVSDSDIQVKIAMSKNPKLTELSTRLLSNQSIDDEIERIKDEEMLRTIYITPNAPSSATTSLGLRSLKRILIFKLYKIQISQRV